VNFASDFALMGVPKTINKSLERLEQSKTIIRIARGIYYYLKSDTKLGLGILYPLLEDIEKLRILLSSRQISDWKEDMELAPAWIKQILISIV